jgi:hypothetical protein
VSVYDPGIEIHSGNPGDHLQVLSIDIPRHKLHIGHSNITSLSLSWCAYVAKLIAQGDQKGNVLANDGCELASDHALIDRDVSRNDGYQVHVLLARGRNSVHGECKPGLPGECVPGRDSVAAVPGGRYLVIAPSGCVYVCM